MWQTYVCTAMATMALMVTLKRANTAEYKK